ncbi:MAG: GNAT family N-acetyltransferase [Lentisphaeria bacterium]|nr:GNAT family N-acetyltransferase [Lentisphaeria bacterium]
MTHDTAPEIRRGKPEDFDLLMDRVVGSFQERNPGHFRFENMYPDTVSAGAESMGWWWLAFVEGEMAAGLQIVPRPVRVAGKASLSLGGIGNVFCYPPFRGGGLMSQLLLRGIQGMQEDGMVLSALGGDRLRYGHFGWENAGATRYLTLSSSTLRHGERDHVSGVSLRTWRGETRDTQRMCDAYHALPYHTVRTPQEFPLVLSRPGQVVWICDDEHGFAYVSVRGSSIVEYAGDCDALRRIVRFLIDRTTYSIQLPTVEGETELEEMFLAHASSFTVHPAGMLRVNSLLGCLRAYLPILQQRLKGWHGSLCIRMEEDGEGVHIESNGNGVRVVPTDDTSDVPTVRLQRAPLARLLFGPFSPTVPEAANNITRLLFPLPFHWHPMSHV